MRCINIDWLAVFGGCDYSLIKQESFPPYIVVLDNNRGTPLFKRWVSLYTTQNFKIADICFDPFSLKRDGGIYEASACTIQMSNRFCYDSRLFDLLATIGESISFVLRSVSRIDICYDFHLFDNKLKPTSLIRGYYSGKYLKTRYSKALGVGEQFNDYLPQTLSFKGKNSSIAVKLYNKSKEMRDKKHKRYIEDCWNKCGLNSGDVWRLELTIKSDGRDIVNVDTGEYVKIGIREISNRSELLDIFFSIVSKKFEWLYAESGKRRDRLRKVELFKVKDQENVYKPVKVTASRDYSRRSKVLYNSIMEMLEDKSIDNKVHKDMQMAAFHMFNYYRINPFNKEEK